MTEPCVGQRSASCHPFPQALASGRERALPGQPASWGSVKITGVTTEVTDGAGDTADMGGRLAGKNARREAAMPHSSSLSLPQLYCPRPSSVLPTEFVPCPGRLWQETALRARKGKPPRPGDQGEGEAEQEWTEIWLPKERKWQQKFLGWLSQTHLTRRCWP